MIEITRNTQKRIQTAQEAPQCPIITQTANNTPTTQNALKRPLKPFTAIDGSSYRAAYRAVCEFHERHNPPKLDADGGDEYWRGVWADMDGVSEANNGNPFVLTMLVAVFEELERQYILLQDERERGA